MTARPALSQVLTNTAAGLYCPAGGFHIDPVRAVECALITHAHSDHARAGHGAVLASADTLALMAIRYGENFCRTRQIANWGECTRLGDVSVGFHPAGHVLGSAQIAIDSTQAGASGRIVFSGDYKRQRDPTCMPFEPVRCDIFITEATFALPVFNHPEPMGEIRKLLRSLATFPERTHVVGVYSLGKGQRVAAMLREAGYERPLFLHGALEKITSHYETRGIDFGDWRKIAASDRKDLAGEIVLCPPGAVATPWAQAFSAPLNVSASGWMRVRARARQRNVELPLVISDHAGWQEICDTIVETRCKEVWITHGEADALMRWAKLRQMRAAPLHLKGYGEEEELALDAPHDVDDGRTGAEA